jgi:hypothetical protein
MGDQGFKFWQGMETFLFTTMSRLALESTQPPIQWVPVPLSLVMKQPVRETDHSFYVVQGSRMHGAIPSLPNTPSWRGGQISTGTTFPSFLCIIYHLPSFDCLSSHPVNQYNNHNLHE